MIAWFLFLPNTQTDAGGRLLISTFNGVTALVATLQAQGRWTCSREYIQDNESGVGCWVTSGWNRNQGVNIAWPNEPINSLRTCYG